MNLKIVTGALLFVVLLLSVLLITNEEIQYVCYEGSVMENPADCPRIPTPNVNERSARESAQNFANAVARSRNLQANYINLYMDGADWKANFVFNERSNDQAKVWESVILVNGTTGSPSCIVECGFIGQNTEDIALNAVD